MNGDLISAVLSSEDERMLLLPRYWGRYMMRFESLVYDWMTKLCEEYSGGRWHYYKLSNGGFYMAPTDNIRLTISWSGNGFTREVSADAAGIIAVLFAVGQLASESDSDEIIEMYQWIRDFAGEHTERQAIFAAID